MHHTTPHQSAEHIDREPRGWKHTQEIKKLIRNVAAAAGIGGMALMGAGCTTESSPTPAPTDTETVISYEVPEGTDKLPKVADKAHPLGKFSYPIYSRYLAYTIDKKAFDYHTNARIKDPEHKAMAQYETIAEPDPLPSETSAPVMDVMIGSDGKLRYKTDEKGYGLNQQETQILDAIGDATPMLEAALQSGAVGQVHIRVFQPDQHLDHPSWEPTETGLYITRDYTDGGKPNIYYYLPSTLGTTIDVESVSIILSHEASHALLGQSEAIPPNAEQIDSFTKACDTLHQSALTDMKDDAFWVLRGLDKLKLSSPKEYVPAFQAVIDGIKNGTYQSKQTLGDGWVDAERVPSCFLQDPFKTFVDQIRSQHINGGTITKALYTDAFETEFNEIIGDWHDLIKEKTIFAVLNEASYLPKLERNKAYGHSYENILELTASTTNLPLVVPQAFGEQVAKLPANQKAAVLSVIGENIAYLRNHYANNKDFIKYLDKQYSLFAGSAKIA